MNPAKRPPVFRVGDVVVCSSHGLGTVTGRWGCWFSCYQCNEPIADVEWIAIENRKHHMTVALPMKCPECGAMMVPRVNSGKGIYYVRFGNLTLSLHGRLLKVPKVKSGALKANSSATNCAPISVSRAA